MAYIKLDASNVVIYKTPYAEDGTIEVPDSIVCGMIKSGKSYIVPAKMLAETPAANNAPIFAMMAAADLKIIRALTEGDTVRIEAHKTAQAELRAKLV